MNQKTLLLTQISALAGLLMYSRVITSLYSPSFGAFYFLKDEWTNKMG
jgi:hypothetical protein